MLTLVDELQIAYYNLKEQQVEVIKELLSVSY
jgi:hypothetical protein